MNSDSSFPRQEGCKRKYAENLLENTEDQALALTPKRQRLNNRFLNGQNQESMTFRAGTRTTFPHTFPFDTRLSSSQTFSFDARLSSPQTFSFDARLSSPQTFSFDVRLSSQTFSYDPTSLETAFNTFASDPAYDERCQTGRTQGDALTNEDTYWQLADQYYDAPSDDDVNINADDDADESDEDDFDESDDECDLSEGGYEGDDDETDEENTNNDDADDNEEENGDDEYGNDEEEYEVDDEDEEEMTEEEIGLLLYEIFDASYNTSPYDHEE